MTAVPEIAGHWFGLCRKPPVIRASQVAVIYLPEPTREGLPGGGGPGAFRRGIEAAISGMITLNRNRQLLWFALLAGLVLAGNIAGQTAFWYAEYGLHMQIDRIAWQFLVETATLFSILVLLGGLFLSIPPANESPASFREGLFRTGKYLKTIFLWSVILALAAMLVVILFSYVPAWYPSPETLFLYHNGPGHLDSFLSGTLSRFPFNLSRLPPADLFTEIPGYGGRSVLLWFYFGFRETLVFSAINLLLFVATPFVVPLLVSSRRTLMEAVAGSFALVRKTWVEVAACTIFLGGIVAAAFLSYLLIEAVHGRVTPLATYYHPADMWIVLGLFYDLALIVIACVMATAGGIAAQVLCTAEKSGLNTGFSKQEPVP